MNIRRFAPVIAGVAVLGLWGFAFVTWGKTGPQEASIDRPGGKAEVKEKLDDLKTSVMGRNTETRGRKVVNPRVKAPDEAYDYTPREACLQMKVSYPEKYGDVDCESDKYSSPHSWMDTPGMK